MNFSIDPFFYTTPLQSLIRILAGEQRKGTAVYREGADGRVIVSTALSILS
jgi:hypothetical protein